MASRPERGASAAAAQTSGNPEGIAIIQPRVAPKLPWVPAPHIPINPERVESISREPHHPQPAIGNPQFVVIAWPDNALKIRALAAYGMPQFVWQELPRDGDSILIADVAGDRSLMPEILKQIMTRLPAIFRKRLFTYRRGKLAELSWGTIFRLSGLNRRRRSRAAASGAVAEALIKTEIIRIIGPLVQPETPDVVSCANSATDGHVLHVNNFCHNNTRWNNRSNEPNSPSPFPIRDHQQRVQPQYQQGT